MGVAYLTVAESEILRKQFVDDCQKAFSPLRSTGLDKEIPVMSVFCAIVNKYNDSKLPWFNLDSFMNDARSVLGGFGFWDRTYGSQERDFLNKHLGKDHSFKKIETWNWSSLKESFDKKNLIRQTDSLIRDLVKAIGNDNNRLTDVHLICAVVGKLHVGEDTNIWKEAAKLYTKRSFVKFFKDLLDHSGRVHNASYTDLDDLVKVMDWQLDNHPTLHGGKQKWGSQELTW